MKRVIISNFDEMGEFLIKLKARYNNSRYTAASVSYTMEKCNSTTELTGIRYFKVVGTKLKFTIDINTHEYVDVVIKDYVRVLDYCKIDFIKSVFDDNRYLTMVMYDANVLSQEVLDDRKANRLNNKNK